MGQLYKENTVKNPSEAERRVEQLEKELFNAHQKLIEQEKFASIGKVVAGVSHEIKNPLSLIEDSSGNMAEEFRSLQEIIESKSELFDKKEYDRIEDVFDVFENSIMVLGQQAKRVDSLTKNMLRFSRNKKDEIIGYDLISLICENMGYAFHSSKLKRYNIHTEIIKEFDYVDTGLVNLTTDFSSLLLNVFENSFDALYEKYRLLNGDFNPKIEIDLESVGGDLIFRVYDNGIGIEEENIAKLGEPFYTSKKDTDGTGLGMSIVKSVAAKNSGKLEVTSKFSQFTCLEFKFPIKKLIKKSALAKIGLAS